MSSKQNRYYKLLHIKWDCKLPKMYFTAGRSFVKFHIPPVFAENSGGFVVPLSVKSENMYVLFFVNLIKR